MRKMSILLTKSFKAQFWIWKFNLCGCIGIASDFGGVINIELVVKIKKVEIFAKTINSTPISKVRIRNNYS